MNNFEAKELNEDIINNIPWANAMYKTLESKMKENFTKWIEIVLQLSKKEDNLSYWRQSYIEFVEDRFIELNADIKLMHEKILNSIEQNLNKIQELCKLLKLKMPILGEDKRGLFEEELILKNKLKELEEMMELRKGEIKELNDKQLQLCKLLGAQPKAIDSNSLLSVPELEEMKNYIQKLEEELFDREEQCAVLKESLNNLVKDLGYIPNNHFEKEVLYGIRDTFEVTPSNMKALKAFYSKMEKLRKDSLEELDQIKNKVEQLWTLLDIDFLEREEFRKSHTGNSLKVLDTWKEELKRCNELKKNNIKNFVEKMREELKEVWKQCHCSEEIEKDFVFFTSDCYTEDLLELHEVQLNKWKSFAEENRTIINALNEHKELWDKLLKMEESMNGPDRYKNRGGKLLKEEKERNRLANRIPKIEENLLEEADRYEACYGTPFLTFGQTVADYINNLHEDRENLKKVKLSARKGQNSFLPPSQSHYVSSRTLTPRKALTEPKKMRAVVLNPITPDRTAKNTISRSKRYSLERKKRLEKIRRLSRSIDSKKNISYLQFESDLSHRVDLRSTLNVVADSSKMLPPNVSTVPTKSPRSAVKSGFGNKLTTAKASTKLIF